MSDMKTEQLLPGQNPAGLAEGGQPTIGATHEVNTGFGEARDLEPGEVEKMFGPATTPLERLRAAGNVEENPEEMGGGGDATDAWVAQKGGYDKLLQQIQQNGWADNMVWKLDDGTKLSVAEVKRRTAAAVTPPPPEPQPTPRPADWRDALPPEQRQRLREKEQRWDQLQPAQLAAMQEKISTALSNWGLGIDWPDELKKANISPEDGSIILKALGEEIGRKQEVKGKEQLQLMIDLLGLRGHFDFLKVKYKLTDDTAVSEYLKEADRKAKILFRNLPYDLFPLKLQEQIISLIRGRRNGGI